MAELHIVGSIDSGHGFAEAAGLSDLFLKWTLESGPNFRVVQGLSTGQTHCDHPDDAEAAVWSHPLDVHYTLKGIDGWPRISLEVWGVDRFGRNELAGYGVCMVPTTPGLHRLECATWRPSGTLREQLSSAPRELRTPPRIAHWLRELRARHGGRQNCALAHSHTPSARPAFFLGGVPVLKHKELVASPVDRFRLQTEPSGVVQINIGVVVKDFKKYGVSVS